MHALSSNVVTYCKTCLKIISFCSLERIGLPLVKSVRSIAQALGSQLSTIRQWNSLNPSLRNMESIAKFKTELRKQKDNSHWLKA
jgi:hypothetical protein